MNKISNYLYRACFVFCVGHFEFLIRTRVCKTQNTRDDLLFMRGSLCLASDLNVSSRNIVTTAWRHWQAQSWYWTNRFRYTGLVATVIHSFHSFLDRFGSKYRSTVTGIIYNDEMDDFDIPDHNIVDGISPSPVNFPEPKKRPFSSISPAILTNDNGDVQLVIGASGGKRITTAVSLVCYESL